MNIYASRRTWSPAILVAAFVVLAGLAICLPAAALAHGDDESPAPFHGRMPDQPDVRHVGKKTYRYLPGREEYEVTQPGKPAGFLHLDYTAKPGAGDIAATEGPGIALPPYELDPVCRTSGPRIVVVYTHRPADGTATPTATLRSIVKRMNWKFADQSSQSSGGKRVVKMAVDCSAGQINVFNVAAASNYFGSLTATVASAIYGEPTGEGAVKYLIFDHSGSEENIAIAGLGGPLKNDSYKSRDNYNAVFTAFAVLYNVTTVWETHDTIHELTHALGGSQTSAPHASPGHHCDDGLDALCYADGTIAYFRDYCPSSGGYETPTTVPIDCDKDTYFNAAPESGSWLAENWDLAGREDWFLTAPPKATTGAASEVKGKSATVSGIVDPEGTQTSFYVEYGKTTSYGSKSETEPLFGEGYGPGANGGPESVQGYLFELSPATTYHYRVVAINRDGVAVPGSDLTFTTTNPALPTVTTEAPTGVALGEATLKGTVNPNGSETTYQFEYGNSIAYGKVVPASAAYAGSEKSNVPVSQKVTGLEANTVYHFRLKATSEGGTAYGKDKIFIAGTNEWGIEPIADPSGATSITPAGISCVNAESCVAVGSYTASGVQSTLAKVKSASLWSLTTPAKPSGATLSGFSDVACTAANACTAVGGYKTASTSPTLAERWNGTSWSIQTTPNPATPTNNLTGISCAAANDCMAVGGGIEGTTVKTLAERWNGTTWSIVSIPNVEGFEKNELTGISCVATNDCWAVGKSSGAGKTETALAEHWNGTAWSINSPASTPGLTHVSCASTSSCLATTRNPASGENLLLARWNGTTWSQEKAVAPANTLKSKSGVYNASLKDVSCTAASACVATGEYLTTGEEYLPLAEAWNGSKWTIQSASLPSGATTEAGAPLSVVACISATQCTAFGRYFASPGTTQKTMIEARF